VTLLSVFAYSRFLVFADFAAFFSATQPEDTVHPGSTATRPDRRQPLQSFAFEPTSPAGSPDRRDSHGGAVYRGRKSEVFKRISTEYFSRWRFASLSSLGTSLAETAGSARPARLDFGRCRYGTSKYLSAWKLHPRTATETGLHRAKVAGSGRIVKNFIRDAVRRDVRLSRHATVGRPVPSGVPGSRQNGRPGSRALSRARQGG